MREPIAVSHACVPAAFPTIIPGCEVLAIAGLGKTIREFGTLPAVAATDLGRRLLQENPSADAIFLPSPHWPTAAALEPLERAVGVAAMSALQAFAWDALRLVGVTDRIDGYGRLLRDF